jgi:hypothetical protein
MRIIKVGGLFYLESRELLIYVGGDIVKGFEDAALFVSVVSKKNTTTLDVRTHIDAKKYKTKLNGLIVRPARESEVIRKYPSIPIEDGSTLGKAGFKKVPVTAFFRVKSHNFQKHYASISECSAKFGIKPAHLSILLGNSSANKHWLPNNVLRFQGRANAWSPKGGWDKYQAKEVDTYFSVKKGKVNFCVNLDKPLCAKELSSFPEYLLTRII